MTGDGEVRSEDPPIFCRDSCTSALAAGTLDLVAVADQGWTFKGWTGACSGSGTCTISLTEDAEITASFERVAPDACAGLVPSDLTAALTRSISDPASPGASCGGATSDGAGDIAAVHGGGGWGAWTIWGPDGSVRGTMGGGPTAIPQPTGFQSVQGREALLNIWTPQGSKLGYLDQFGAFSQPFVPVAFPAATDGNVVVQESCGESGGYLPVTNVEVWRFDQAGAVRGKAILTAGGCARGEWVALSDALDRTLIVLLPGRDGFDGFPNDHLLARWLASDGSELTDWFDAGAPPANLTGGPARLRPLIGGGAVLSLNGSWIDAFPSGEAVAEKPPSFLSDHHDLAIIHGGKAYALIPNGATGEGITVLTPSGIRCGEILAQSDSTLSIGRDGTVLTLTGDTGCQLTWWPRLLQ